MQSESDPPVSALAACERCHRRKARCDKAQPACSSCIKAQVQCQYSLRNPAVRRHDVEKLERRLRQLQARNDLLSRQLRETQQARSPLATSIRQTSRSQTESGDESRAEPGHIDAVVVNDNEVAGQVSDLSLNAGAGRQFLGPASGLLLASLLHVNTSSSTQGRWQEGNQVFGAQNIGDRGCDGGQTTPKRAALPSETLAQRLLAVYLAHDHLCYPFLHPMVLQHTMKSVYENPDYYEEHIVESFTIDMVLAIGTAQVCKFDRRALPDATTHYHRAMTRLGQVFETGGIVVLQAILLLCQYRMLSAAHDTSTSIWHLIGIAARICLELGLHRESIYALPLNIPLASKDSYVAFSELKRRCFWSVFAMDRIVSLVLGRPLAISIDDIDTELPKMDIATNLGLSSSPYLPEPPINLLDSSRTAIFVHITRYRAICGKMLTSLHNATRARNLPTVDFADIRLDLEQELEAWHRDTESLPQLDADFGDAIQSSFGSRDWYNLLYYNGVLTLYRPSSESQDQPHDNAILQNIFDAARKSIVTYGHLHQARKINYTWMTLHAVFIAGLSYVYALRIHFQTRRYQMRCGLDTFEANPRARLAADPTIGQVVSETRDCSTVLVAISEHWNYARNCHLVFARLSDAILTDIVQFSTRPAENDPVIVYSTAPSRYTPPTVQAYGRDPNTQPKSLFDGQPFNTNSSYRDCFGDFHDLFENAPFEDNEMMMQASQPWLSGIEALDGFQ